MNRYAIIKTKEQLTEFTNGYKYLKTTPELPCVGFVEWYDGGLVGNQTIYKFIPYVDGTEQMIDEIIKLVDPCVRKVEFGISSTEQIHTILIHINATLANTKTMR